MNFKYFLILFNYRIFIGIGEAVPKFNENEYKNPKEVVPKYFNRMPSLLEKCKTNAFPVKFIKGYLLNDMIVRVHIRI